MISGASAAIYSLINIVNYIYHGDISPWLFGSTPMAFSTSFWIFILGSSTFWGGWIDRESAIVRTKQSKITTAHKVKILLQIINVIGLIIVGLIGMLAKK